MGSSHSSVAVCNYSSLILNIQIGTIFDNKVFPKQCLNEEKLKHDTYTIEARLWNGVNEYTTQVKDPLDPTTVADLVLQSLNLVASIAGAGFTYFGNKKKSNNVTDNPHYANGMVIFIFTIKNNFERTKVYDKWIQDNMVIGSFNFDRNMEYRFVDGPDAQIDLLEGNLVQILNPDKTNKPLGIQSVSD